MITSQSGYKKITKANKLQKTSTALLLVCYGCMSLFVTTNAHAFSQLLVNTNDATSTKKSQITLKLTDIQRKQKIYDMNIMSQHSQYEKLVDYMDFKKFEIHYQKEGKVCGDTYCDNTYTDCYDTFTRTKKPDSTDIKLPEGYQALYLDKQICEEVQISQDIIRQVD